MFRPMIAMALVSYGCAFGGMGLKLPHRASSRMALRTAGPSMKIGVFYGSITGNTENVAVQLAEKLGADKCDDISSIEPAELATYDTLIVGAPTWQSEPRESERSETDWDAIIHEELPGLDFAGKKVLLRLLRCAFVWIQLLRRPWRDS